MRPHVQRAALLTLLALLLALSACGGEDEQTYGGAEALPGPLPSGVEFEEPPAGGVPAPDFTAELLDGSEVTASDLWGDRPVVVVFTASWCEACKEQHARVAETVAEHEGVALLAVVPGDDAEAAREYAASSRSTIRSRSPTTGSGSTGLPASRRSSSSSPPEAPSCAAGPAASSPPFSPTSSTPSPPPDEAAGSLAPGADPACRVRRL